MIELAADVDADRRQSVETALSMWRKVFPLEATLDTVPDAPRLPVEFHDAAPVFHGVYDDESGVVIVNTELSDSRQRAITVAHELGHAFGLSHDSDSDSVMRAGNLKIEPSSRDGDTLRASWGPCTAPARSF